MRVCILLCPREQLLREINAGAKQRRWHLCTICPVSKGAVRKTAVPAVSIAHMASIHGRPIEAVERTTLCVICDVDRSNWLIVAMVSSAVFTNSSPGLPQPRLLASKRSNLSNSCSLSQCARCQRQAQWWLRWRTGLVLWKVLTASLRPAWMVVPRPAARSTQTS